MQSALATLRSYIDVLYNTSVPTTGRRPRGGKLERHRAVIGIQNALSKKSTINALTAASVLEMVRGPQEDSEGGIPPLGWAELTIVLLETLNQACNDALESRAASKTGRVTFRPEFMYCFKDALKLSLAHGPSGVIRPVVPAFMFFAHQWLTEPPLRPLLGDQIWQCVRDILQDGTNRALLTPPFIRTWVDVCVEQLTGRGPLYHPSTVVSQLAGDVLETIARHVDSYDTLTQSTKSIAPSKMSGGDFGYAIICERCCFMLLIAETKQLASPSDARQLQAVAFRVLTVALSDHLLDAVGSNALESIINVSLNAIIACWTDRRYHDIAISYTKVLLLLSPTHGNLIDKCRQRLLVDLRDDGSSAVLRAGKHVRDDFIDVTAACFSLRESVQFASSTESGWGLVIVWLRVCTAILSRRVLKMGTTIVLDLDDVMDQCTSAAEAITSILRGHGNIRENYYDEIIRCSSQVVNLAICITDRVMDEGSATRQFVPHIWKDLYLVLREQLRKIKYSTVRRGTYIAGRQRTQTDEYLLHSLALFSSLKFFDQLSTGMGIIHSGSQSDMSSFMSRLTASKHFPAAREVEYTRNMVAWKGIPDSDGNRLRLRLAVAMVGLCRDDSNSRSPTVKSIVDASHIGLAAARGECTLSKYIIEETCLESKSFTTKGISGHALDAFHSLFGFSAAEEQINEEGRRLVGKVKDQELLWPRSFSIDGEIKAISAGPEGLSLHKVQLSGIRTRQHYSVNATMTDEIENRIFLKAKALLGEGEDITPRRTGGSYARPQEISSAVEDTNIFSDEQRFYTTAKLIVFVGNYLLQGITLGLISAGKKINPNENRAAEELMKLVMYLSQSFLSSTYEMLVSRVSLSLGVIQVSSSLTKVLDKCVRPTSGITTEDCVIWAELSRCLSKTIAAISTTVAGGFANANATRTAESITRIQNFTNGYLNGVLPQQRLPSKRRKRSNTNTMRRLAKKKRVLRGHSDIEVSHDESEDSQCDADRQSRRAFGNDSDDEFDLYSSESEDFADKFETGEGRTAELRSGPTEQTSASQLAINASYLLRACVTEISTVGDLVLDKILEGLQRTHDLERALSPDGFERSAIACPLVNETFLAFRKALWAILFSLPSSRALQAAARDLSRAGMFWKGLERTSLRYVTFYVESLTLSNNSRKHYPMTRFLEQFRIAFLDHARIFLEMCQLQNPANMVEDNAVHVHDEQRAPLYLVNDILDISEHFRVRHAFRMPRMTRVSYFQFGIVALEFFGESADITPRSEEEAQLTALRSIGQTIQTALWKFLSDSEGVVRFVATSLLPRLLNILKRPVSQLETILQDSLPQSNICQESDSCYGRAAVVNDDVDMEDAHDVQFNLSASERLGCSTISNSFRTVGANARACTVFMALGEVANSREDLLPFCMLLVLLRTLKSPKQAPVAYYIFVRLCVTKGYRSPRHLYHTFARTVLSKWFKHPQALDWLYRFPASVVVDENHHREGLLFDWIREQQAMLVPHILILDTTPLLPRTTELAEAIGLELKTLLSQNVGPFSLIFPMQFAGSLHERGRALWDSVDNVLEGKSKELMFKHKIEVIRSFLLSTCCGFIDLQYENQKRLDPFKTIGFCRDTREIRPPLYDPLVVALAINQLFEVDTNRLIIQRSVLKGSLFSEVRDEENGVQLASNFGGFLEECQKSKVFLIRVLVMVSRFLVSPRDPQPAQNRRDAFFCVAMLWRTLGVNMLVKSSSERIIFYRLMAEGFEHYETANDAAWLLVEVQKELLSMSALHPNVQVNCTDLSVGLVEREHLLCMETSCERQMFELLNVVTPILVSTVARNARSGTHLLHSVALEALNSLIQVCDAEGLWSAILSNGPYPRLHHFSKVMRIYEASKANTEVHEGKDDTDAVVASLKRFHGVCQQQGEQYSFFPSLACIQELRSLLSDTAVRKLSLRMRSEAWVRSDGQLEQTVPCVRRAIACLIKFVYDIKRDLHERKHETRVLAPSPKRLCYEERVERIDGMAHEIPDVMAVLGLLHQQSEMEMYLRGESKYKSIPNLTINGGYEGVDCGIRLSMILSLKMLHGSSPIAAEAAISTLIQILRTKDGKKVYTEDKFNLDILTPFRNAARRLPPPGLPSKPVDVIDPNTGESVAWSSLPGLLDPELWVFETERCVSSPIDESWMRRFCSVLSQNCRSPALKSLSPACYLSYQFANEMLPYLMMDVVKGGNSELHASMGHFLCENILNNLKTPTKVLRSFVHALDVMCQVGSDEICRNGMMEHPERRASRKGWPILLPRYVVNVPYIDAARAALRSGCYFSAVRYSQMHVDEKIIGREFRILSKVQSQKPERKIGVCLIRDSSVIRVEETARKDVKEILRMAMTRIQEPDGVRAFSNDADLAQAAANLAMLNKDWIKSLSTLDIISRVQRGSGWSTAGQQRCQWKPEVLDINRELSLFHSFIGLGTLSIATDYWNGLRDRISQYKVRLENDVGGHEKSPVEKLNDLRYAVAWKLGQWEPPPVLPTPSLSSGEIEPSPGFHEIIYRVLHSFRTERFLEASRALSHAKMSELLDVVGDTSGVSAGAVYASASRLQIFRILEEAQFQSLAGQASVVGQMPQSFDRNLEPGNGSELRFMQNVNLESPMDVQMSRRRWLLEKIPDDVIGRVLHGSFSDQDTENTNSELIPFRDAFNEITLAEELPLSMIQCLRKEKETARAAATLSARIFRANDSGAWARSASCLGTEFSSCLSDASHLDRVAWKLQEARLTWFSSQDAASRKLALVAVKDLISSELGGRQESGNNRVSEGGAPPQAMTWDTVSNGDEKYAFLRSEACQMAATWSLDMRTHEPLKLFETFLVSGLQAIKSSAKAKHLASSAHFAMATFADAQLANIEEYRTTRKYDEMVSSLQAAEEKIGKLRAWKDKRQAKPKTLTGRRRRSSRSEVTSGPTTDHQIGRDLRMLINNEEKKAAMDRSRLEKLKHLYEKWQIIACQHFASCLRDGNAHDLKATFRFVALWLDAGHMRDRITTELATDGDGVDIGVPVSKLLPLAPQLSSRLSPLGNTGSGAFQTALSTTVRQMAEKFPAYCLWQLLALSNSTRVSANQEKYSSLYLGDKDKKEAADKILNDLTRLHGDAVCDMKKVADAYILLSETNDSLKDKGSLDLSRSMLLKLGELQNVPVPTVPLPLNAKDYCGDLPHIVKFEKKASVCAGLSKPLRIVCYGSDGKRYPQMVKGRDDLRGDAVMEQLFTILNSLLEKDANAAKRSLLVRTYRIVPLSPFSGIMQFVSNTQQFKEILTEKNKSDGPHHGSSSLHERYRPNDMKHEKIFQTAYQLRARENQAKRLQFLAKVWQVFQPVFRFFFLEQWPDPAEWFSHQLAYSRSVAVMSVVGFILGLGDRHLSNILLDVVTGEVVHIDFGIAFEQGKLLPTPERMPFRLTRDLVDGFGIAGVEGVFRRCSEVTLSVMRRNKDALLTIVEVLLHDPMFNWALTPEEVLREQNSRDGSDQDIFESDDLSRSLDESAVAQKVKNDVSGSTEAHRALNRISEKLDGLEGTERLSVEAHVARLIDEAQAFHVIAAVYPGWAPWL